MVNINGQTKPLGPEQQLVKGARVVKSCQQSRTGWQTQMVAKTQRRVHTTTQNDVWAALFTSQMLVVHLVASVLLARSIQT